MKLVWEVAPYTHFATIAPSWDRLNAESFNLPFLESHFIQPMLTHFDECHTASILVGRHEGQAKVAVLINKAGALRWQTLQPSQLPLGPMLLAQDVKLEQICQDLMAHLPNLGFMFAFTEIDPRFIERPATNGHWRTLDYIQTAWVDVVGSFDDYWNARGKNLRQNMRKQRNKLEQDNIKTHLDCLTQPEDVAPAIEAYGRLESAGWKAENGTAIHPSNPQGRFYTKMMEDFCRLGRGRIYRYRFNEQVVAMDLCIESNQQLVILKTTYDESIRTLSPAFLMRQDQFMQLFAEGQIKRIEFYGRMMEWHTRWTEQYRTLYHANYYRWPLLKRIHESMASRGTKVEAESTAAPEINANETR